MLAIPDSQISQDGGRRFEMEVVHFRCLNNRSSDFNDLFFLTKSWKKVIILCPDCKIFYTGKK